MQPVLTLGAALLVRGRLTSVVVVDGSVILNELHAQRKGASKELISQI